MIPAASRQRGFALITVLCVLLIVSGVALALATSMSTVVRRAGEDRSGLEAEQLCAAGQDMADYLKSRALGTPLENLTGLPVEVVQPAFHYVIHFPTGDVDLYMDAEDGKLNLSSASPEMLESFFTAWADDAGKGHSLSAAVQDWRDPDSDTRPGGAEAGAYQPLGYAPRNRVFGIADFAILAGIAPEDLRDRLIRRNDEWKRRPALTGFLTNAPTGATINPAFASELLLRSLPGLTAAQADRVLEERRRGPFRDLTDFSGRVGLPSGAPAASLLHFVRRVPAVLTVARGRNGRGIRSERRVAQPFSVEFNILPDYVDFLL